MATTKAPTPARPAAAPTTSGAKPESLSAPDAGAPAVPAAPSNPAAPATGNNGTVTGQESNPRQEEQNQAERAVLGQAPASGDTTAQERPEEQKGTRTSGPAATSSSDALSNPENDFNEALASMGEREPSEIAAELIEEHGSLVRHPSGVWSAPNAAVSTGVTGARVAAPFVTDKVVQRLIASGDYRAASTLRGRPRSVVAVKREEPSEAAEG